MPFMSYQVSPQQALESAGRLVKEGLAQSVKLEGGQLGVRSMDPDLRLRRHHDPIGALREQAEVPEHAQRLLGGGPGDPAGHRA